MAGNVAEWTTSVIEGAYPSPTYDTRGGSYAFDDMDNADLDLTDVRLDLPGGANPMAQDPHIGFRCVRDAL